MRPGGKHSDGCPANSLELSCNDGSYAGHSCCQRAEQTQLESDWTTVRTAHANGSRCVPSTCLEYVAARERLFSHAKRYLGEPQAAELLPPKKREEAKPDLYMIGRRPRDKPHNQMAIDPRTGQD